ncbi:hypothetical protein HYALB_00004286 [Hymenoscyphus albidus]|uniref:Glycosyltransferase family 32 protein n=1 Tax=Hymenoscyphus albidus TaxID=595503 RepID=A0A9N9Q0P9_9HELO|nr:hypothetical protein HYALB_00004286 [Hymenoscyphus albidus]
MLTLLPFRRFAVLGLIIVLVILFGFKDSSFTPSLVPHSSPVFPSPSGLASLTFIKGKGGDVQEGDIIPNVVHYVWILDPAKTTPQFNFKHFLSMYSAFLHLEPEIIYLHTNANSEAISRAKTYGSYWTRKVLSISQLVVREVQPPTKTTTGLTITALEHQSDFLRPNILSRFGGIYLDFDVFILRDFRPLREAGFKNVFGHELLEKPNNGLMMSVRGSRLMDIFDKEQHLAYDKAWTTHSVELLARLAAALTPVPFQVLVMERKAFTPDGWLPEEHAALYLNHQKTETTKELRAEEDPLKSPWDIDLEEFWNVSKNRVKEDWELDYSSSYAMHAFIPKRDDRPPKCREIDWAYVMERRSNYAVQMYPVLWHASKWGFISGDPKDHV